MIGLKQSHRTGKLTLLHLGLLAGGEVFTRLS
jgi:hypothetical protein